MKNQIVFSNQHSKELKEFLNELKNNHSLELEIRFGRFTSNGFDSNISSHKFENIKRVHQKFFKHQEKSQDFFYLINGENWRFTQILGENENVINSYFTKKQKIQNIDVKEYDFRVSLASETIIQDVHTELYEEKVKEIKKQKPTYTRNKSRYSFELYNNIRLDMTVVYSSDGKITHEVEIEFTNSVEISFFQKILEQFLIVLTESHFLLPNSEKKSIISQYLQLLSDKGKNTTSLIGAQAVSLQLPHLDIIKSGYAITDKADGERYALFITQNGLVCLLSSKLEIRKLWELPTEKVKIEEKTVDTSMFNMSILDGELVNDEFYTFDILVLSGKDIRGDKKYLLPQRLGWASEIVRFLNYFTQYKSSVKIFMKNFYWGNSIFKFTQQILSHQNKFKYNLDGLIFTPLEEPYPKKRTWTNLFKWKFEHMISIDFKIQKERVENNKEIWNLFVNKDDESYIYFQPDLQEYRDIGKISISVQEAKKYPDGSIVEFILKDKQFVPTRVRNDKTRANHLTTALSVFENMLNPVKETNFQFLAQVADENLNSAIKDIIISKGELTTNLTKKEKYFETMRKFHNQIKREMVYELNDLYKIKTLLSFGSGKGGDMKKWSDSGIKKVIGFDVNESYIKEAFSRKTSMNLKKDYYFEKCDLGKEFIEESETVSESTKDFLSKNKVDAVEAQFCLHYFLKNEESFKTFILNVIKHLKTGGIFYGTILDGKLIHEKVGSEIKYQNKGETVFSIKKNYNYSLPYSKIPFTGSSLFVSLEAETIQESDEFLVKFDELTERLKNYGLVLKGSHLFSDLNKQINVDLQEYEKTYSFLSRTFAFQYKGSVDDKIISLTEGLNLVSLSETPSSKLWKNWTWKESVILPGFLYTTHSKDIKTAYSLGELNSSFDWILLEEKNDNLVVKRSNFSDNQEDIKRYLAHSPEKPFYVFFTVKNSELLISYKKQKDVDIHFNKMLWQELEKSYNTYKEEKQKNPDNILNMKLTELKEVCKSLGLPVSGKKSELIERITKHRTKK